MPAAPRHHARSPLVALATAIVLGLGVLAGCGASKHDDAGQADPTPAPTTAGDTSSTPSPSQTASPSATASESPTASAATPTSAASLEDALLTARQLPQLNDTLAWRAGGTGSISSQPFGVCQRFDLLSIGAERGVQRGFTATDADAGQQVVDFPDAQNAVRARKVLEGLHAKCAANVKGRQVKVAPLQPVAVSGGQGWWYLVSWTRGGEGHFETFGIAAKGIRMSLVRIGHTGQDHDYEPGKDPGELAVRAAAARLG